MCKDCPELERRRCEWDATREMAYTSLALGKIQVGRHHVTSLVYELPLVNESFTSLVRFPVCARLVRFGRKSCTAMIPVGVA